MAIGRIPEPLAGIQEAILDAKGDLISATAADTPARLAVGSNNQILMADSAQSTGLKWAASATSTLTAKGDLLTATAANTIARLGVGADGTTLVADSTQSTGLKWATATGGGKILQVVSATYGTEATSTSTTWADTGLSASITPSATSSKVLVTVVIPYRLFVLTNVAKAGIRLLRGTTFIYGDEAASAPQTLQSQANGATAIVFGAYFTASFVDSPSTTSSTTYKAQFAINSTADSQNMLAQSNNNDSTIILQEIGA